MLGENRLAEPHITILMATFNGARFLPEQLQSLAAQSHSNWSLLISDDGSQDATLSILQAFGQAHPARNLRLIAGPGQTSAVQNFMALLACSQVAPGMVALSDQDDVWLPDKLARAVWHLRQCPESQPAIYGSQSIYTDEHLVPFRQIKQPAGIPNFRNALVQNLFSGHSTVLNAAAIDLVRAAGTPIGIAFHDWWLYQLVAGAGGSCLLDPAQTVLYRQHGCNAFGAARGISAKIKRLGHLMRGDYGAWLAAHWRALHGAAHHLTPQARGLICDLQAQPTFEPRAAQFHRLRLHRASAKGTVALQVAARLGWV